MDQDGKRVEMFTDIDRKDNTHNSLSPSYEK
jgi:hypothetical protein